MAAGDAASASSGASGAGLQLPTPDLTGGLFVSDHVKYPQPMAYTITHLCWSLLEFPDGLSDAQKETARQVIRWEGVGDRGSTGQSGLLRP
jgi:hypothetical protein